MKNLLILIVFLTISTAFASCPIDSDSAACIAEFTTKLPEPELPRQNLNKIETVRESAGVPNVVNSMNDRTATKPLRTFAPKSESYTYNSSCQFGICRNTGTPRNFGIGTNR